MHEVSTTPQVLDRTTFETSDLSTLMTFGFADQQFEFGSIQTSYGQLCFLGYQENWDPTDTQPEPYPEDTNDLRFYDDLQTMRKVLFVRFSGESKDLLLLFGYQQFPGAEVNRPGEVTIMPTASVFNSVMTEIYKPSGNKPPMTFIEKTGKIGRWNGRELVEALTDGNVLTSSIEDPEYVIDDYVGHALGFARLDDSTFKAMMKRSKQLVKDGKLELDESGYLKDKDARAFVDAVHTLTGTLNYADIRIGDRAAIEVEKTLRTINYGLARPILLESKFKNMRNSLLSHQEWLGGRVAELRTAA